MRVKNKGGVAPRDRRVDRGKVAMAAIAVVLLFATNAKAGLVEFVIDTNLSSLGFVERFTSPQTLGAPLVFHRNGTTFTLGDPALNTGVALTPAYAYLASSTTAWGSFYANLNTGASIQFVPGGRVNYNTNADNIGFGPGNLFPFLNSLNNPQAPPGGIPAPADFGFEISHLNFGPGFGVANLRDVHQDFGNAGTGLVDGGPALPYTGGNNYQSVGPNALMTQYGWQYIYGATVDSIDLSQAGPGSTPFPSPFAGNVVTWDGVTLTIPLNYHLNFVDGTDTYDIDTFGQIVAYPKQVPEPSTMLMLGFGVAGLLSYAWRARKRRAA